MKIQYEQLPKRRTQVTIQKSAATTADRHPVNNTAEAASCTLGAKSNSGAKATESNKAPLLRRGWLWPCLAADVGDYSDAQRHAGTADSHYGVKLIPAQFRWSRLSACSWLYTECQIQTEFAGLPAPRNGLPSN